MFYLLTMSEEIIIKNAKVFDPKSNVKGDKMDILVQNGVIVDKLDHENEAKIIDATRLIAFPGAIDLRSYWYSPLLNYIRARAIEEENFIGIPALSEVQHQYLEHGFLTVCESEGSMVNSKLTVQNMCKNSLLDHLFILELGSNWSIFSDLQQTDKIDNISIVISTLLRNLKGYGISISAPYHQQFWKLLKTPENPDKVPILGLNPKNVFKDLLKANLQIQPNSSTFIQPYEIENETTEQDTIKLLKELCENLPKNTNYSVKHPVHLSLANHYFTKELKDVIQLYCENDMFEMDVSPLVFGLNRPLLTNLRNFAIDASLKSKKPITTIDFEFDTELYITTRNLKNPDQKDFLIWFNFLAILLQLKKLNRMDKISLCSNAPMNLCLTDIPYVFNWLLNTSSRNEILKMLSSSTLDLNLLLDGSNTLNLYDIANIISYNPAKSLRIDNRKGHLGVGADADICLFNLDEEIILRNDLDASKHIIKGFSSVDTILKKGIIIKHNGTYNSQMELLSMGRIFWNQGKLGRFDNQYIQKILYVKESFFNKHYSMQLSSLENKSDLFEEL